MGRTGQLFRAWCDDAFYTSLKNNVIWLVLYLLAVPCGLFIALFLNQTVTGIRIYKSLFFFPFVISQVVVGLIFSWFYAPAFGLFYVLIEWVTGTGVAILAMTDYVTYGIIAAGLWPQIAYCMILYLTGLNAVDPDQIEAARLDGAKGWRMLWHVVLPQLRPATFIAVVVTVIGALRSFDLVSIMTTGGPFGSSRVLSYYMFEQALSEYGYPHGLRRGHRRGAVRHHDDLHLRLHLEDVPRRERADRCSRAPSKTCPAVSACYQDRAADRAGSLAAAAAGGGHHLAATVGRPGGRQLLRHAVSIAFRELRRRVPNSPIAQYLLNSFRITIPTVIGAVALSCLTGFALGSTSSERTSVVFFMFVAGNFVPFQILMVPVRDLTVNMGLYNTDTGLALFHIAFQTGFCTLFMRNFISALPRELIEAARVEGVNEWQIFWYVVMPLMRPAIAALSVLIFTFIWNDYFWAMVLTTGAETQPVTAGLTASTANGSRHGTWCRRAHSGGHAAGR